MSSGPRARPWSAHAKLHNSMAASSTQSRPTTATSSKQNYRPVMQTGTWQPELEEDMSHSLGHQPRAHPTRPLSAVSRKQQQQQEASINRRPMSARPAPSSTRRVQSARGSRSSGAPVPRIPLGSVKKEKTNSGQLYDFTNIVSVEGLADSNESSMSKDFKLYQVKTSGGVTKRRPQSAKPMSSGGSYGEKPLPNSQVFRSEALGLEIALQERLRIVESFEEGGPERLQIFRELFNEIIEQDKVYGHLLAMVKDEYEADKSRADEERLRGAYNDLLLEHTRVKRALKGSSNEKEELETELRRMREESQKLRHALTKKDRELDKLQDKLTELNPASNTMLLKTQALHSRIAELEASLQAATQENEVDEFGGRPKDISEIMEQNQELERLSVELQAEVELLRRRERELVRETSELKYKLTGKRDMDGHDFDGDWEVDDHLTPRSPVPRPDGMPALPIPDPM